MPHLRSLEGIMMMRKYVDNWFQVLSIYLGINKGVNARFKDGKTIHIRRRDYFAFYRELYSRYLQDNGFTYAKQRGLDLVTTPDGLVLILPEFATGLVFDEIYLMKVYGRPDLMDMVAIDLGASIGDSTLFLESLGADLVYGYEIDKIRYELALKNIALNNLQNKVLIYNEKATAEKVNKLLDTIVKPVFLKVDIEGGEYEVLPNLNMSKISEVAIEYHAKSQPLVAALRKQGFQDVRVNKRNSTIIAKRRLE